MRLFVASSNSLVIGLAPGLGLLLNPFLGLKFALRLGILLWMNFGLLLTGLLIPPKPSESGVTKWINP